ncbi:beta-lactamase family protein [Flavobacterium sp. CYK-4]|uniref:serine hydrolase domain-containing protein n=1 Tax=Flavobacterium lotistagni TaxID=2709660 RepID=UPI00140D86ED|nr:serine hydrolase domain-containing protein [Flavobacterium lotistagni]NHM07665.1 beta-lactamase family protein [Flavobacterium lotistagni]
MTRKSYFIYIPLFCIGVLFATCSRQDKADQSTTEPVLSAHGLPTMQPSKVDYTQPETGYLKEKKASVENYCNKYWSNPNNNFSFLVAKNGQIVYERYQGVANREQDIPLTSDTPLHIASVSKVLTATAILLLVNNNKIELDQKVNTIIENFPYPEITIRTLLNHRSGLRNYAYFTEDKGVWDRHQTLTNQDVANLLAEKNLKLDFPTDTRFAYCNTNYAILALIIEKIAGISYPQAMEEMIFKPLGMNHTYVFEYDRDLQSAIPSYKGSGMRLAYDYLDAVYGDKNIYSTPRDLLKFDMARVAPTFLNRKLCNQIYKGYSNEHKGQKNYGLGMRMIEWETGQKFYFHNGWWHGNTSSFISLIKDNVTIIALSNKFNKNVYSVRKLAPVFGDYPFEFGEED